MHRNLRNLNLLLIDALFLKGRKAMVFFLLAERHWGMLNEDVALHHVGAFVYKGRDSLREW